MPLLGTNTFILIMKKRIPISVGIIGHLDAIVTAEHIHKITELFDDLERYFPNSPVCFFSQLAEGADTVIAKLFIEIKNKKKRAYELIAPLPYDVNEYEKRFDDSGKQTFNYLLSQAHRYFVLDNDENLKKEDLYRLAGKFVADSSIILIALCQIDSVQKKGGTVELVNYKTNGTFDEYAVESIFDMVGMPIVLDCERASDNEKRKVKPDKKSIFTQIEESKNGSILKALKKIEELNQPINNSFEKKVTESARELFSTSKGLDPLHALIRRYYAITNTEAVKNQNYYKFFLKLLFWMGLIIVGCFEWYKHMQQNGSMLLLTLILIGIASGIYLLTEKKKYHSKFLENRILAESLRIQFFWNIGNVNENVSNCILKIHNTEYNWIKHILSAIYGACFTAKNVDIPSEKVINHWVKHQNDYFKDKVRKLTGRIKCIEHLSRTMFIIGFLLMGILFFKDKYEEYCILNYYAIDWIILLTGVSFSAFALLKAYLEKRGFDQILNQYILMGNIYEKSAEKITQIQRKIPDPTEQTEAIGKIYRSAGKEALIENGNWYLIFKKKHPEIEGLG